MKSETSKVGKLEKIAMATVGVTAGAVVLGTAVGLGLVMYSVINNSPKVFNTGIKIATYIMGGGLVALGGGASAIVYTIIRENKERKGLNYQV